MSTANELLKNYTLEAGPYGALDIRDTNRVDLAKFLAKFAKTGAEIGVAHGKYSEILMNANPDLTLHGVDPYETYKGYKDYQLQRTFEALRADAHTRLDKYPNYHFIRKTSMDALADFEDGRLDFVYIDANHTAPWVGDDIREWAKKVRVGGVVAGHDYSRIAGAEHRSENRYDVLQSVNQYVADNHIQLYVWGLNSNADKSLKRDRCRSWMFFQPEQ